MITRQIFNDGHHIANHTWAHYRLDELSKDQIQYQIHATSDVLDSLGIHMSPFFRPPGGRFNQWVLDAIKDQGLKMVMWDVNAGDYVRSSGKNSPRGYCSSGYENPSTRKYYFVA